MTIAMLAPILSPHGHLLFAPASDASRLPEAVQHRLADAFARGSGHGLLRLGAGEVETVLPAALVFWREFATRYITGLCTSSELAEGGETRIANIAVPPTEDLAALVAAAWKSGKPPRPRVKATMGSKAPSLFGTGALLDFSMELTLDGERLTAEEIKKLLASSDGLQLLRGRWVEVDSTKLEHMLEQFRRAEQTAAAGGLPFAEAMRAAADRIR
jgi:hypothetical protein